MFFQSVKMAWHAVTVNKLRTFLTMLGIIIGVVALIVLVSIADGATNSVADEISGMGSSYLTVSITDDKENPLRLSEMSDFADPDEIQAVAPVSRTSVTAKNIFFHSKFEEGQEFQISCEYGGKNLKAIKNLAFLPDASVVTLTPSFSANHLPVFFCSTRTTFILLSSFIVILFKFNAKVFAFIEINENFAKYCLL